MYVLGSWDVVNLTEHAFSLVQMPSNLVPLAKLTGSTQLSRL